MLDLKLNIIDGIILIVTPSTIVSVEMSCHHRICLFESHCNIAHNVVSIFIDEFYHWTNSVNNFVCKTYTSSYCVGFFFNSLFSHYNFLGIYRGNIPVNIYR